MQYGTKANGRLEPITTNLGLSQQMSQPGQTYEAHIDTQGVQDENTAITNILQLESYVPDLKVTYVQTNPDGSLTAQFKDVGPGQFGFETIMAYFPQLLMLSGIIMIAITLFWVVPALQTIPNYVWYLAAGGGLLIVMAWLTGALKLPQRETGAVYQRGTLESKQLDVEKEIKLKEMETERLEKQAERIDERVRKLEKKADKYKRQGDQLFSEGADDLKNAKTVNDVTVASAKMDRSSQYYRDAEDSLRKAARESSEVDLDKKRLLEADIAKTEELRSTHARANDQAKDKKMKDIEKKKKQEEKPIPVRQIKEKK